MILDNRHEDELYQLIDEINNLKYRMQQLEIELHSLQNEVYEYITITRRLERIVKNLKQFNNVNVETKNNSYIFQEVSENE